MFSVLIFDLDDTLVDTSRFLVPQAVRSCCESMVEAGLASTVDDCIDRRQIFLTLNPGGDFWWDLIDHFGVRGSQNSQTVRDAGYACYYQHPVPSDLPLIDNAAEILRMLRDKHYRLHLVTSGHPETQIKKIKILKLDRFFDRTWIANDFSGEHKTDIFTAIQNQEGVESHRILCIGDRLNREIREGKQLGFMTCFVRYGEFAGLQSESEFEKPDFVIGHISELVRVCQL